MKAYGLRKKDIRAQAIANFKVGGQENVEVNSSKEAIECGFRWRSTPEGWDYWTNVYNSKIELLPEPQFPMVDGLELLKWVKQQDWCHQKGINDYWYTFDDKGVERQVTDAELLTKFQNREQNNY